VGGSFTTGGNFLIRLNISGTHDSSFAIGSGPGGTVYSLAQTESGPLFVGGNFFSFNGSSARPITKIAGGVSPYDFWKLANFTSAQIAAGQAEPGADPDADGSDNALERALGTNPNVMNGDPVFGAGSTATITLEPRGGERYLQVTLNKGPSNAGAWFVAQFSSNVQTWSPAPPLPGTNSVYTILEDSPARFVVREKAPLGSMNRFVRIGVSHPE
jgi:hypothetical protein